MKIKDGSDIRNIPAGPAPEPTRKAAEREKVTLSESRGVTETVSAVRGNVSAERIARIETLKTAVRSGTYRPDPQRIAEQILEDAQLTARLRALLLR